MNHYSYFKHNILSRSWFLKLQVFPCAGASPLCVQDHVQDDQWLQAESDALWELHSEDPSYLAGRERILDRAHILLCSWCK